MLHQAALAARRYSGRGELWQHPYAEPRPRAASALASVWFTAYPPSHDHAAGRVGARRAWATPSCGASSARSASAACTPGPMKRAGGIRGPRVHAHRRRQLRPHQLRDRPRVRHRGRVPRPWCRDRAATRRGVIGDIIPGHTGKGADFRLAERRYGDYPGLYHMVEIDPADWALLPGGARRARTRSTSTPAAVDQLRRRLHRRTAPAHDLLRAQASRRPTGRATDVVVGADGTSAALGVPALLQGRPAHLQLARPHASPRRGWSSGDAIHSLDTLGERDAAPRRQRLPRHRARAGRRPAWSEGHPLSVTANQLIAGLVRKLGGFTFQELNLTLEDIKAMSQGGADLSYDFVTRPAYHHALVTGDAAFLRLDARPAARVRIEPAALIHALQNHDELTLELVHFWTRHKDDTFTFRGKPMTGGALRDTIRAEMHAAPAGPRRPLQPARRANGVACTTVDRRRRRPRHPRPRPSSPRRRRRDIQRAHLLLAMYNAMQPGVFALSGWDLVGALDAARRVGEGPDRRGRHALDQPRRLRPAGHAPERDEVEQRAAARLSRCTGRCPSSSRARTRSPRS